jgi:hypothetical protein
MAQQTAVEQLEKEILRPSNGMTLLSNGYIKELFVKAKEEEKQQRDNLLLDIDIELAKIEDYAHGEVGNAITDLRGKIQLLMK